MRSYHSLLNRFPSQTTPSPLRKRCPIKQISSRSLVLGNSLAVQWLGLGAFTAKSLGSIPGQGTKIQQDTWHSQSKKKDGFKALEGRTNSCFFLVEMSPGLK